MTCVSPWLPFWGFRWYVSRGAGIACWLERLTRARKVASSNPGRSGGRNFFSRVNLVFWLFIRCPFQPRVTAVALKRPRLFCQKCRWQVTPKHAFWHNEVGVGWLCRCPGIVLEPIRKRAHTQVVMENSVTVVSARRATVDWFWPKPWN